MSVAQHVVTDVRALSMGTIHCYVLTDVRERVVNPHWRFEWLVNLRTSARSLAEPLQLPVHMRRRSQAGVLFNLHGPRCVAKA